MDHGRGRRGLQGGRRVPVLLQKSWRLLSLHDRPAAERAPARGAKDLEEARHRYVGAKARDREARTRCRRAVSVQVVDRQVDQGKAGARFAAPLETGRVQMTVLAEVCRAGPGSPIEKAAGQTAERGCGFEISSERTKLGP